MEKSMSMREANQSFSAAAAFVAETGEELIITNRGKPYVKVVRVKTNAQNESRQTQALETFLRTVRAKKPVGTWSCAELYDDEVRPLRSAAE